VESFIELLQDWLGYFLFVEDFFLVAFLTEDFLADFFLETDPPPPESTAGTGAEGGLGVGVGGGGV